VIVDRDGGDHPNPAEFALAAEQAASARTASIVTAHTASQIISIVTVMAAALTLNRRRIPDRE
jgi:hypothetical protein